MYVCICNALTESKIKEKVEKEDRVKDVFKKMDCSPKCCKCVDDIKKIIEEDKCSRSSTG